MPTRLGPSETSFGIIKLIIQRFKVTCKSIFSRRTLGNLKRRVTHIITQQLRKRIFEVIGPLLMKVSLTTAKLINLQKLPYRLREAISLTLPGNPLENVTLPTIDIGIVCHQKDFSNLHLVIEGARRNVTNPIGKVVLVTPEHLSTELQSQFPDCLVLTDESVLGIDLMGLIGELVPQKRRGWIVQQVIKFRLALMSNEVASLILDADTILLQPRIWLDRNENQILCVSDSWHLPMKKHQRKMLGGQNYLLMFVTHHQLMKRDSVRAIFGASGDGLFKWLKLGDYTDESAISEYDTYGEWMVANRPEQIKFAKWNNFSMKLSPDKTSMEQILCKNSQYHSISNHSYL
jgi:hypothetical protein